MTRPRRYALALLAAAFAAGCGTAPRQRPPAVVALHPGSAERTAFQVNTEARLTQALQGATGLEVVWITEAPAGGVLVGLSPAALFSGQQAVLRPAALGALGQMEDSLRSDAGSVVQILGPRPVAGASCPTYRLSDREAQALASYWIGLGFPAERLRAQGRDEDCASAPAASAGAGRLQLLVRPLTDAGDLRAYQPAEVP